LWAMRPGALLALERGQSDVVLSLLAWWAIAAASRGRWGWATFLAFASALMKPYAMRLAIGMMSATVELRRRRASVIGALAAAALLLLPVARFLRQSRQSMRPCSQ